MKKKWTTGKIIGVSMLLVLGVVILWIAFVASVYQLATVIEGIERTTAGRAGITGDSDDMDGYDIEDFLNGDSDEEYYDFEQDIRDDLSYEVELEEFDKEDYDCPEGTEARLAITYPVVTGDIPNVEEINRKLYEEVTAADEYITAVADLMEDGDSFEYQSECYVTYMDEDILSVAFQERGILNDSMIGAVIVSMNFDLQTGLPVGNTGILDIDDEFAIDFRKRCEEQNGEINGLNYYSDQQIREYLTNENSLIIFYTPLGMEVGINYDDGWATVTY
ncbi:hypothetical protein, partial [Suilimivivens sp.]|uniref:hypothetical protein n=1 Tax=Suilimivivens sp. TaxID=2981669 RepID=UPI00307BC650